MKNVNIRIPDDLLERVRGAAEHGRRSVNAEILWLIERSLSAQPEEEEAQ